MRNVTYFNQRLMKFARTLLFLSTVAILSLGEGSAASAPQANFVVRIFNASNDAQFFDIACCANSVAVQFRGEGSEPIGRHGPPLAQIAQAGTSIEQSRSGTPSQNEAEKAQVLIEMQRTGFEHGSLDVSLEPFVEAEPLKFDKEAFDILKKPPKNDVKWNYEQAKFNLQVLDEHSSDVEKRISELTQLLRDNHKGEVELSSEDLLNARIELDKMRNRRRLVQELRKIYEDAFERAERRFRASLKD